jgi:hypothetical protein
MIVDFCENFNVGQGLTKKQATDLAIHLQLQYFYWSIEDLACCLLMIRDGKFGKVFGLDMNKMIEFLTKFDILRSDLIVETKQARHGSNAYEDEKGDWKLNHHEPRTGETRRAKDQEAMNRFQTEAEIKGGPAAAPAPSPSGEGRDEAKTVKK